MGMGKTLCEWKKGEILEEVEKLAEIVRDSRFVCRKCARSAHEDKHLCKPLAIPKHCLKPQCEPELHSGH
jgi:hypothetical protein